MIQIHAPQQIMKQHNYMLMIEMHMNKELNSLENNVGII